MQVSTITMFGITPFDLNLCSHKNKRMYSPQKWHQQSELTPSSVCRHVSHAAHPSCSFSLTHETHQDTQSLSLCCSVSQPSLCLPPWRTSRLTGIAIATPLQPLFKRWPALGLARQFGAPPLVQQPHCCDKVIFHSAGLTKGKTANSSSPPPPRHCSVTP